MVFEYWFVDGVFDNLVVWLMMVVKCCVFDWVW